MTIDFTHNTFLREAKDYIFITLGVFLYAVGVTAFMLPYGLTTGGVAGIASIVYYATGLEVQNTYIAINVCFLLVAVKVLGVRFCLKTIYAVFLMTFVLWLLQRIIEVPDPQHAGQMMLPHLIDDQSFMAAVLGAIFCGIGLAFCFENNGSTGGTDIIAAIVNKYKPMSLGNVIMACDVVIISSCYFIFHDWSRVIFGFVILILMAITLDYAMRRYNESVQFMIFSRNYSSIADAIAKSGHGVTLLDGEGWYTKSERRVVLTIVRQRQANDIFRVIKQIDPYALVSMAETKGVFGNAFDTMKQGGDTPGHKLRTLVICSNNSTKLTTARKALGGKYDVRSLFDVGCDTRNPFNAKVLTLTPKERTEFVKEYFGFDAFYFDANTPEIILTEGDFATRTFLTHTFTSLQDMRAYLEK